MARIVSILIAVWTLLAAPSLCQTGVLLHDCYGSTCGHEASCDADPCSETIIKVSVSRPSYLVQTAAIAPVVDLAPPVDVSLAATSSPQADFDNPPNPQFMLPLLI